MKFTYFSVKLSLYIHNSPAAHFYLTKILLFLSLYHFRDITCFVYSYFSRFLKLVILSFSSFFYSLSHSLSHSIFPLFSFFSFHSKVVFKVSIPLGQQVYMQLTYTLKTCPCILSEWDGWYMIIKVLSQRIVWRWANFENVFWLLVCQPWKWQNN